SRMFVAPSHSISIRLQRSRMFVARRPFHHLPAPAEPNVCSPGHSISSRLQRSRMFVARRPFHRLPAPAEPNVCSPAIPSPPGSRRAERFLLAVHSIPSRLQGTRIFVPQRFHLHPAPAEPNVCSTQAIPSPPGSSGAECLYHPEHCISARLQRSRMFVAPAIPSPPGSSGAECL